MVVVECDEEGCKYHTADVGDAAAAAFISHHLASVHPPKYLTYPPPEVKQQEQVPLMDLQAQEGPPSYHLATGTYPTQEAPPPIMVDTNPTVEDATQQFVYPTGAPILPSDQLLDSMRKKGVMTVCCGCNQQVVTSVHTSLNGSACCWGCYSFLYGLLFCFFLLCMDHFKTWKHSCPRCGRIFKEFSPNASGRAQTIMVLVILINAIICIFGAIAYNFRNELSSHHK